MKRWFLAAGCALLLAGCSDDAENADTESRPPATTTEPAPEVDVAALTAEAEGSVAAMAASLTNALQAAIKAGGPVEAIGVCKEVAPAIAQELSVAGGHELKRVSLKNRNPEMGVPNAWQTAVLEDFDARRAAGEDPGKLVFTEVADGEYRFMKAIPTAPLCLTCHGTDLAPELAAELARQYPDDRAVGYREGEVRGAFVVTRTLP